MKYKILTTTFLSYFIFPSIIMAQSDTRSSTIIRDSVFYFKNYENRPDSLIRMSIDIQLKNVYYDTCGNNNSLRIVFKLVNKAKLPIFCLNELDVYHDAGISPSHSYAGRRWKMIKPDDYLVVTINFHNNYYRYISKYGGYLIKYGNTQLEIPISFRVNFEPEDCSLTSVKELRR